MTHEHHTHKHVHVHSCCNGHSCGKCDCCQGSTSVKPEPGPKPTERCPPRWPWIVAVVLLVLLTLLALIAWYLCYQESKIPPPYPRWTCGTDLYVPNSERAAGASRPRSEQDDDYQSAVPPQSVTTTITVPPIDVNPGGRRKTEERPQGKHPDFDRFVRYSIAEADGSPIARALRDTIAPPTDEQSTAQKAFVWVSERDGKLGLYRLGLAYLDLVAFEAATNSPGNNASGKRLYVPFCPYGDFTPYSNDEKEGYIYLKFAEKCQTPGDPVAWQEAVATTAGWSKSDIDELAREADERFIETVDRVAGNGKPSTGPEYEKRRAQFCRGTIILATGGITKPPEVLCEEAQNARQALKLGDAEQANGQIELARACWRRAIELAPNDPEGAEAAMEAERRLKTNTSTCKVSDDSLAAISRDYKARSGDLLSVAVLQQSLKALGHYDGPIDGELSKATREAIRKFQGDREEDQTDMLTPDQTVRLVCTASETTSDNVSQTALGIMHAAGLGVEQNIDQALTWLKKAERREYPDAKYNLAILYGTGIVLDSYRLCDVARAPDQADKYLQEAAALKHPIAMALMKLYGPGSPYAALKPVERWQLIESQQLERSAQDKTGLYAHRLRNIGTKCAPDRSIR